jgi:hypothetical protein
VESPDLAVVPNPEMLRDENLIHGKRAVPIVDELLFRYDLPSGGAAPRGWVLMAGPSIRADEGIELRAEDLAPIILHLQGLEAAWRMDGEIPRGILGRPGKGSIE